MGRIARCWALVLACQLTACSFPDYPVGDDDEPSQPPVPSCDDQMCAGFGGVCSDAGGGRLCLLPDTPCDPQVLSVCKGNIVHECQAGFAVANGQTACQDFEQCYQATYAEDSGAHLSFAHCAVDPAPCSGTDAGECRGNVAVQCGLGFPSNEQRCDAKKRCAEFVDGVGTRQARCVDDVTCPADVSPQTQAIGIPSPLACDGDALIECDSAEPFPLLLDDCSLFGEHCSTGGVTTCTVSASGPAAPQWRAVPAGHFTPGLGLIAGVPTDVSAFEMLRTEVTLGQYDECVRAGACSGSFGCEAPQTRGDVPLGCTVEAAAAQYCGWLGARLPTAAEWEYAARNAGAGVIFPWGNDPATCADIGFKDGSGASGCDGEPTVGCRHARDVTTQGICDMAGNLSEWVTRVDPSGASKRGQNYLEIRSETTLGGVDAEYTPGGEATIGFRCVR